MAGGRYPKLLDDATRNRFVTAVRSGVSYQVAAKACGVTERTIYAWLEKGRDAKNAKRLNARSRLYLQFLHEVETAEAAAEVAAVVNIRLAGRADWRAELAFLQAKYPERWGRSDKQIIEIRMAYLEQQKAVSEFIEAAAQIMTPEQRAQVASMLKALPAQPWP